MISRHRQCAGRIVLRSSVRTSEARGSRGEVVGVSSRGHTPRISHPRSICDLAPKERNFCSCLHAASFALFQCFLSLLLLLLFLISRALGPARRIPGQFFFLILFFLILVICTVRWTGGSSNCTRCISSPECSRCGALATRIADIYRLW